MSRARIALLPVGILAVRLLLGQNPAKPADEGQLPPEEDAALNATKQYGFNPVQSRREVDAGMVYFKKGSYKAAAYRFSEATKWNDGNADAWLKLGEAEEKRGNATEARAAFQRYIELVNDAKKSAEVKKKLQRLQ